ncbi:GNAT family N-acetyltransferase [Massilia sp. DWR3-1-1]|uniref:GNAT family N-acetyltransferase n=1 Tax=Massilia sp. DWR3-1-1 TaxID=2804559 RepID=UPI003CF123F9
MQIRPDDLSDPAIHALLEEHLASMRAQSPPGSVHALDLARLRDASISFWSAWEGATLLGCAALRQLDAFHGEIKSMRTPAARRRRGAGKALLAHLIAEAQRRGYHRLSLETGAQSSFAPARTLYANAGFVPCAPFGDYLDDPNSAFMTRTVT